MLLDILMLLAGLALVVFGAEWLVNGSSDIARRAGLSEFVIGLTIIGIGTSLPEMVVSFMGAFQGNPDISAGNVVGSNIFNVMIILGLTAMIRPIEVTRDNRCKDIPHNLFVTALFVLLGFKHTLFGLGTADMLSRWEGLLFVVTFACYLFFSFAKEKPSEESLEQPVHSLGMSLLMVVAGLAGLIAGGRLFVNGATGFARLVGVSDKFIAITILAGGTSLPELATCVVAAVKGKGQLALGNIIGSNISNLLLILGGSALICPLSLEGIGLGADVIELLLSAIMLAASAYIGKKHHLGLRTGIVMLLFGIAYFVYLFMHQ